MYERCWSGLLMAQILKFTEKSGQPIKSLPAPELSTFSERSDTLRLHGPGAETRWVEKMFIIVPAARCVRASLCVRLQAAGS